MAAHDLFTLESDALPPGARMLAFQGAEGLSRPYSFALIFLLPADGALGFDPDKAVGERATLTFHREDGAPRSWTHGVFASIELAQALAWHSVYRATLTPRLWELSLSHHSRVWVDKKVPEILEDVLKRGGLAADDFELRLTASYAPRAHVCQYHESDLDFLSRWMEREGIYYYFEQLEDRERLVLVDSKSAHGPLAEPQVRFVQAAGGTTSAIDGFQVFGARHLGRPTEVKLKDYDPLKPGLDLSGTAKAAAAGAGAIVSYGDNLATPDEAKRIARVRAEELLARAQIFHATGRVFDLRAGYTFDLEEHPRPAYNASYLVTDLVHRGQNLAGASQLARILGIEGDKVYEVEATAIGASVQFRPARATPWPRVQGIESATIDGAAESEYAQLDEHGRYFVRILFDESGLKDGKASTRVRMLQPHGGEPEGIHFPLRKGTEVLLGFLGGDPDRPVIVGVGPNALNPAAVTSANHTHNVIQTGGLSRIEIEDLDGAQYVDTSTPPQGTYTHLGAKHGAHDHNVVIWTDGDGLIHTGGNRDIKVGGDQTEDVKGDLTEDYHANQTTHVYANFTETIDAGATQTIHAGAKQTIDSGQQQTIDGGEKRDVVGGQTESISGGRTQTINGSSTETIAGALTQSIVGGATIKTPANVTLTAVGGLTILAPAGSMMDCAGGVTILAPGGHLSVDNVLQHVGSDRLQQYGINVSLLATKLEFDQLVLQAYGSWTEFNINKVDVAGNSFCAEGTELGTRGAKTDISPVEVKQAAASVE